MSEPSPSVRQQLRLVNRQREIVLGALLATSTACLAALAWEFNDNTRTSMSLEQEQSAMIQAEQQLKAGNSKVHAREVHRAQAMAWAMRLQTCLGSQSSRFWRVRELTTRPQERSAFLSIELLDRSKLNDLLQHLEQGQTCPGQWQLVRVNTPESTAPVNSQIQQPPSLVLPPPIPAAISGRPKAVEVSSTTTSVSALPKQPATVEFSLQELKPNAVAVAHP